MTKYPVNSGPGSQQTENGEWIDGDELADMRIVAVPFDFRDDYNTLWRRWSRGESVMPGPDLPARDLAADLRESFPDMPEAELLKLAGQRAERQAAKAAKGHPQPPKS